MKRIHLNDISLSKKLMAIYLLIVAIPVLIMGTFFPAQLKKEAVENITSSYQYTAERIGSELRVSLQDYLEIPLSLAYDKELILFLNTDYNSDIEQYNSIKETINPIYEKIQLKNPNLRLKILHSNPSLNMSGLLSYTPLMENISKIEYGYEKTQMDDCLTAAIPVIDTDNAAGPVGILKVYIPLWVFEDIMSSYDSVSHPVFLYDAQGTLVAGTHDSKTIENNSYQQIEYWIQAPNLQIKDWKLIYMMPSGLMKERMNEITTQTWSVAAGAMCVAGILIFLITKSLRRRLGLIVNGMKKLRHGDTKVQIEEHSKDEIGQLCEDFNVMVKRLDQLIRDNYQSQIDIQNSEIEKQKIKNEQVKTTLLALQRQINPHYLFNTLESIRMRTLMNGDRETAGIIEEFASGYREIMYTSSEMITIREELNLIQNFFTVIRFRFGNRIQLNISLENNRIQDYKIFKFSIQPLVENAVYHGVECMDGDGRIDLKIYTQDDSIVISVKDNGVGMSREKIDEILEGIRNPKEGDRDYLALRNIYARLTLVYKERFHFNIESQEGSYTCVQMRIPVEECRSSI